MKKNNLLAILALAASPAFLHAQTESYSDIVGYQKTTLGVGLNPIGIPLLNSDLFKGSAVSLSGSTLSLASVSNVGALLTSGEPHYLEVYSGALKGDRFDIDTAATITAANGAVVLNSASANNTLAVSNIGAALDGATVAVRRHITLEKVQSFVQGSLVGNNTPANADQILIFNPNTQSFLTYYLRLDGITWRGSTTGTATQNKVPVPPGVGVFLKKNSSGVDFLSSGLVRQNDFSLPYKAGLQLLAPGFPLAYSPSTLGATAANGWSGNNTPASADQIQIFNTGSGAFATYYLRLDGSTWRGTTTGTAPQTSNNVVSDASAFFVKRASADANNVLLNPVQ
jgi:hypothetical protein